MTNQQNPTPVQHSPTSAGRIRDALAAPNPSARLRAALTMGTAPQSEHIEPLVGQCAVEPDFYVRDMLTWALIQHETSAVIAQLLPELNSAVAQARSQALHTLSKIADPSTWQFITPGLLTDEDDEVARAAWRTAAGLVPDNETAELAELLATQFGRGDRDLQLSLSRAFVELGDAAEPAIGRGAAAHDPDVRAHALATKQLVENPDEGFDAAMFEARRAVALHNAPMLDE